MLAELTDVTIFDDFGIDKPKFPTDSKSQIHLQQSLRSKLAELFYDGTLMPTNLMDKHPLGYSPTGTLSIPPTFTTSFFSIHYSLIII